MILFNGCAKNKKSIRLVCLYAVDVTLDVNFNITFNIYWDRLVGILLLCKR